MSRLQRGEVQRRRAELSIGERARSSLPLPETLSAFHRRALFTRMIRELPSLIPVE
jgi:hypothetical protein